MSFSVSTLGELSLGGGKYGIAASAVDFDAKLPAYLRITDINDDGTLNWNDRKSVNDSDAYKYMLSEGDIVFARTGNSTGRNYYYDSRDGEFAFAGFLIRFSLDDKKVNPRYVKYYAQSKAYWDWIASFNTGSTRGNINAKTYAQMPVPLPDRSTQDSIVMLCDSISNKIRLNTKLNGYLLELMNVQYQHSFCCNKLTLGSIYDIADVVYGAAFKSALFNEEKVGYPLIRIRDLSTFSPQYWTNEAHPKRVFVHPGDVLAGMDAEFTPCLWQGEMAVLNQRVCLFEPAANSGVSRSYLLMALNPLLAFIQNYASGTTVAHMGKGDLEALNVPIPARGDLERFNTIAEPLREQIVQNSIQNRKLAALRDALLPKLMSGEIDVSRIDLTQLNSHLAETLRPFGCHIPAIQKRGSPHSCEPPLLLTFTLQRQPAPLPYFPNSAPSRPRRLGFSSRQEPSTAAATWRGCSPPPRRTIWYRNGDLTYLTSMGVACTVLSPDRCRLGLSGATICVSRLSLNTTAAARPVWPFTAMRTCSPSRPSDAGRSTK